MADAVAEQIAALKDEDWAIREEAAMALGTFRDPRAVGPLVCLLRDADRAVRQAAIGALTAIVRVTRRVKIALPPRRLKSKLDRTPCSTPPLSVRSDSVLNTRRSP